MTEFIAFGDMHLEKMPFGEPVLRQDIFDTFVDICNIAITEKAKYLINCGDMFDTNKPSASTIAFVRTQVDRLEQSGIKCLGIAGDHDKVQSSASWALSVAGFKLPQTVDEQYYGVNYDDDPTVVTKKVNEYLLSDKVKWMFMHGQLPQLFGFCEEKKTLDFSKYLMCEKYKNVKGIILGDIHVPSSCMLNFCGQEVLATYCGSPACLNVGEVEKQCSVVGCVNDQLTYVTLEKKRPWIIIDTTDAALRLEQTAIELERKYAGQTRIRPLFIIEYTKENKAELSKLSKLYEFGIVRTRRVTIDKLTHKKQASILRQEISTKDRIYDALIACEVGPAIRDVLYACLQDPDSTETTLQDWKAKL